MRHYQERDGERNEVNDTRLCASILRTFSNSLGS
jgi:hypothetical protein